jgi:hypothetical protein
MEKRNRCIASLCYSDICRSCWFHLDDLDGGQKSEVNLEHLCWVEVKDIFIEYTMLNLEIICHKVA